MRKQAAGGMGASMRSSARQGGAPPGAAAHSSKRRMRSPNWPCRSPKILTGALSSWGERRRASEAGARRLGDASGGHAHALVRPHHHLQPDGLEPCSPPTRARSRPPARSFPPGTASPRSRTAPRSRPPGRGAVGGRVSAAGSDDGQPGQQKQAPPRQGRGLHARRRSGTQRDAAKADAAGRAHLRTRAPTA